MIVGTGHLASCISASRTPSLFFDISAIERAFDAGDGTWIRYARNCWMVQTYQTSEQWRERIRAIPAIGAEASILIIEFDPHRTDGYLEEWAWKWLHRA